MPVQAQTIARIEALLNTGQQLLSRRRTHDREPEFWVDHRLIPEAQAWITSVANLVAITAPIASYFKRGFPDSSIGFIRQAEALFLTGRLAEARTPAERALALGPDNTFAQMWVGPVFYALGNYERVRLSTGS